MEDIDKFFRENIDEKRKPRGEKCFVAPHAYYEYQAHLFLLPAVLGARGKKCIFDFTC